MEENKDILAEAAKNYIDPEVFEDLVKRFGLPIANGDSLAEALDRIYVANADQMEDYNEAMEAVAELREEYEAELAEQIEAGEITQEHANSLLRKWKPSGIRVPSPLVVNLLVMGDPGGGKTSIIEQWGRDRGVKIVKKTAADITASVSRGLPAVDEIPDPEGKVDAETGKVKQVKLQAYLPSTFFDQLDDEDYEYTVLFVDEINRGHADAESAILTLVCDHTINNRNFKSGRKKFNQYLFTVAACNPPANNPEARKLSLAMATRFRLYVWNNSPQEVKKFIGGELENKIKIAERKLGKDPSNKSAARKKQWNEGRKEILDALIDGGLLFSDSDMNNEVGDPDNVENATDIHVVNARTLMSALYACDGTVGIGQPGKHNYPAGSFMDEFKEHCTDRSEVLDEVELMLTELNDDMNSRANGFQKTLYNVYMNWFNKNGAKHGLQ